MRIYLAAQYSRQRELHQYRQELEALGMQVVSRWLDGHDDKSNKHNSDYAIEDLEDIDRCDVLISFMESRRDYSSGGRHVEFGYAIAKGLNIIIVGPRENIFCYLPTINQFRKWEEAKYFIDNHLQGDN